MVRRWCLYLAIVLGCLVLMAAYEGWLAWMLLLAVLGTPVLSLAVSLPAMLTIRVETACEGVIAMGAEAFAQVGAFCAFPIPEFRCKVLVTRALTGESQITASGQKLPTEHCGKLLCEPYKCYVYDYLNLFRLKVRNCAASSVTVMPRKVEMAAPETLQGFRHMGWKPKFGGGFAENHELRLYRPGDGMNQVHWKLTAKTGKLMIREAMEPVCRLLVLTVEIMGEGEQMDRKMGRLLWLGEYLLERNLPFEIHALTADGVMICAVRSKEELSEAMLRILGAEPALEGQLQAVDAAQWCCYIGGGTDEA